MKRIIILAILLFASTTFASGGRPHKPDNLNFLGSDDHKSKHGYTVPVDPDRPVHPVPEPLTIYLLGAGLAGIGLAAARKK